MNGSTRPWSKASSGDWPMSPKDGGTGAYVPEFWPRSVQPWPVWPFVHRLLRSYSEVFQTVTKSRAGVLWRAGRRLGLSAVELSRDPFQQGRNCHGVAWRHGIVLQVMGTGDQRLVVVARIIEHAHGICQVLELRLRQLLGRREPSGIKGRLVQL
jgi:hypothetical protein